MVKCEITEGKSVLLNMYEHLKEMYVMLTINPGSLSDQELFKQLRSHSEICICNARKLLTES